MAIIGWKIKNADQLERIIHQQLAVQDRFEMTGLAFQAGRFVEEINLEPAQMMEHIQGVLADQPPSFEIPPEDERTQMQVLRKFCARLDCAVEICPWQPRNLLFTRKKDA